jgi:pyrroloquinoline quinone biosynthesis protein D
VRHFVGYAGCSLFCIRGSGLAAAGRVSTLEGISVTPELTKRPRLAPGCRLNEKSQPSRVLLMPERALRLNGPSLEIVERCDGSHTIQQIVADLQKLYSKAEPQKVQQDILGYLERLQEQRALDFE